MKTIDYKNTKCYFKVQYEDGNIFTGTINIDEKSMNNEAALARLVIDHEIGDIIEIKIKYKNEISVEKCKIIEKKSELVFEEVIDIQNINNNHNWYLEQEGFVNIKFTKYLNYEDIYFLYYYKPAEWKIPGTVSNLIIRGLKERNYNPNIINEEFMKLENVFRKYFLKNFNLEYKNYVLCCVPSHGKSDYNKSALSFLLRNNCKNNRFIDGTNYLIRCKDVPEQKRMGKRYKEIHLNSVRVSDKLKIEGKKVILVDDITTSGSSLNACREILINNGAKEVICFAFGKDT